MQIIRHFQHCPPSALGSTLVIGKFDAIHLGHQYVIGEALKNAKSCGQKLAILTFKPHPAAFFKPECDSICILPFAEKIKRLAALSVDFLFIQRFNQEFAALSAVDFVGNILVDQLKIKHLIVGEDFAFGAKREGNINTARQLAIQFDFKITTLPLYGTEQQHSSSQIRNYLSRGEIDHASKLLGYNYYLAGRVIHGAERGKTIGCPTANITLNHVFKPLFGVYCVRISIACDPRICYGVANLGAKPTFDENTCLLEVHIFDFDLEIYGKKLKVELLRYIRPQQKFASIEELKAQIGRDINEARQFIQSFVRH